jgi:hypothetical protein
LSAGMNVCHLEYVRSLIKNQCCGFIALVITGK